jgi:hypothetical protein
MYWKLATLSLMAGDYNSTQASKGIPEFPTCKYMPVTLST